MKSIVPKRPPTPILKSFPLLMTALTAILLIAVIFNRFGYPEPYIHDEFAYLLGADTFLEGRLTNPTPPLPEFFETFHVNMTPTYHSKYPPGQSAFLALGKLIFGREIYGVWLSFVLAAVAVTWALMAVFPPRWAFLGGLLSIGNSTLLLRWAFSYWGGSVAMLGGALLMGGLLRVYRRPSVSGALWTSAGLFLLAFSRPLEGFLTSGILLLIYIASLVQPGPDFSEFRKNRKFFIVLTLVGGIILGLNLFYNNTLTGSAFTFPHMKWNASESTHHMIRAYRGSLPTTVWFKSARYFNVFIGPFLSWPLFLILCRIRKDLRVFTAVSVLIFVSMYTITTSRAWPHYIAPTVPFLIGLQVSGCWLLSRWEIRNTRIGIILLMFILPFNFGHQVTQFMARKNEIDFNLYREEGTVFKRDIDRFLEADSGKKLILVRYLDGHSLPFEYVYNRADIPSAKVIWAREMSQKENLRLFEAYPERQIWLLKLRNFPAQLSLFDENEQ